MKYSIIITLTLVLHFTNGISHRSARRVGDYDYGEDADPNTGFEVEDEPPKPIYKLAEAPKLFEKFIKDFNKRYRDGRDKSKHYSTFVENLKEINTWNSDSNSGSSLDINMFSDLNEEERVVFTGGLGARSSNKQKSDEFLDGPGSGVPKSLFQPGNAAITRGFGARSSSSHKSDEFLDGPGSGVPKSLFQSGNTAAFTGGFEARSSNKQKSEEFLDGPGSGVPKSLLQPSNIKKSSGGFSVKGLYRSPVIEQVKPIYNIEDAPKLFEKFVKDYNKVYKTEIDRLQHYKTFVETLKEINAINSNREFSEVVNIDIFADLSSAEKVHLV